MFAPTGGAGVRLVYVVDASEAARINERIKDGERKVDSDVDPDDDDAAAVALHDAVPLGLPQLSAGQELVFERRIKPDGTLSYHINNKAKTRAAYVAALAAINVFVDAKNFIVFQGDVTRLANRSAKDLMGHFETISGSIDHAKDYDQLLALKSDAEQQFILVSNSRKTSVSECA